MNKVLKLEYVNGTTFDIDAIEFTEAGVSDNLIPNGKYLLTSKTGVYPTSSARSVLNSRSTELRGLYQMGIYASG